MTVILINLGGMRVILINLGGMAVICRMKIHCGAKLSVLKS